MIAPASKTEAYLGGDALRALAGDDFDRDVWSVLGLPIDLAAAPDAVVAIEAAARDRRRLSFVTPNVNFLARALRESEARRQIIDADLSLIDGALLVVLGRLIGVPIVERCAGSDVFEALRRRPGFAGRRLRVFFFGGRDGSAAAASAAVDIEGRGIESAGFFNPGAGDLASMSTDAVIDRINAAGADFVLVALGAAKGQAWIDQNSARLTAPIIAHLGAVIDFAAGAIVRAPLFLRRWGLEWAWRIKEDPALWRRYLRDAAALGAIIVQRVAPLMLTRSKPTGARATADLQYIGGRQILAFGGDLVAGSSIDAVRVAFRSVAREGSDIIVDLKRVTAIGPAFLGLLLMLEKALRASNASISISGASRAQRRIFRAHGMPYAHVASADRGEQAARIAASRQSA